MLHSPVSGPYRITTRFDEPRPLSVPPEQRDHVHGAVDLAIEVGTQLRAPEAGVAMAFRVLRNAISQKWEDEAPVLFDGSPFPFMDYTYDTYGAVVMLMAYSGRVHLFAHSYFNQLFRSVLYPASHWAYKEQRKDARWPMEILHTFDHPLEVKEGSPIGISGNGGYSTGPHVHWEIHPQWGVKAPYADRIDPETLLGANR